MAKAGHKGLLRASPLGIWGNGDILPLRCSTSSDWSPMHAGQAAVGSLACTSYWVLGLVCYLGLALSVPGGPGALSAPVLVTWSPPQTQCLLALVVCGQNIY